MVKIPIKLRSICEYFSDLAHSTHRFMASIQYLLDACMENADVERVFLEILKPIAQEIGTDENRVSTATLHVLARRIQSRQLQFVYED